MNEGHEARVMNQDSEIGKLWLTRSLPVFVRILKSILSDWEAIEGLKQFRRKTKFTSIT